MSGHERTASEVGKTFALSAEPDIKTKHGAFSRNALLVFEGAEALSLAGFCYLETQNPPILLIECGRGEGKGPHIYEGAVVRSIAHDNIAGTARLSVTIDDYYYHLTLDPNKTDDPSGTFITRIETLREYFPMDDYLSFRRTRPLPTPLKQYC